jgi:hypothetical protein
MLHERICQTYIRSLLFLTVLENFPQHINRSIGLDSNTSDKSLIVDVSDKGLGVGLFLCLLLGSLGCAGEGGLVVEAVEVAASLLEFLNPFLGLSSQCKLLYYAIFSHS